MATLLRSGSLPHDPCGGITCTAVECFSPFELKMPSATGMCCDICDASEVDFAADRSWAKGMTGGVGPDNRADAMLCRGVMCPKPACEEYEQKFDGRCCTKCT